mmetsp:Transcript_5423/g.9746  ORF Transcript_5423/g.9746 Transcript_5423/m.9746 type:complete len:299 (-) Transcript_5423:93-989(-)
MASLVAWLSGSPSYVVRAARQPEPEMRTRWFGGRGPTPLHSAWDSQASDDLSDLLVNQLHDSYMEEGEARPVSKRFLRELGRRVGGPKGAMCVVCLEAVQGREVTLCLPCSHSFHEKCIIEWLEYQHTCPTCRFILPERTPLEEAELEMERRQSIAETAGRAISPAVAACCAGNPMAFADALELQMDAAEAVEEEEVPTTRRGRQDPSLPQEWVGHIMDQLDSLRLEVRRRRLEETSLDQLTSSSDRPIGEQPVILAGSWQPVANTEHDVMYAAGYAVTLTRGLVTFGTAILSELGLT